MSDDAKPTTTNPPGPLGRWLLERLLAGRLKGRWRAWTLRRLDENDTWAAWYHERRTLERALSGGDALGAAQRDEIGDRLFADLGAEPASGAARRGSGLRVLTAGAAVAAVAVVAVVLWPLADGDDERWQPRGTPGTVGVKVRCVDAGSARVHSEAEAGNRAPLRAPELTCPRSGALSFSATNTSDTPLHFAVVGVTASGEARFYAPFARDARAKTVDANTVDTLSPVAAALASLPADDRVALFAVFKEEGFPVAALADAVARARRSGGSVSAWSALPIASVVQARVELRVEPR